MTDKRIKSIKILRHESLGIVDDAKKAYNAATSAVADAQSIVASNVAQATRTIVSLAGGTPCGRTERDAG